MTTSDEVIEIIEDLFKEAIHGVESLEEELETIVNAPRGEYNLAQVAAMYDKAMTVRGRANVLASTLEKVVERERFREEFVALPENGILEMTFNAGGRSWQHERAKRDVINSVIERHTGDDGELDVPVEQVVEEVLATAGISYWKTTELDRLQLDANDYSTKKPSKFKAKVHRD